MSMNDHTVGMTRIMGMSAAGRLRRRQAVPITCMHACSTACFTFVAGRGEARDRALVVRVRRRVRARHLLQRGRAQVVHDVACGATSAPRTTHHAAARHSTAQRLGAQRSSISRATWRVLALEPYGAMWMRARRNNMRANTPHGDQSAPRRCIFGAQPAEKALSAHSVTCHAMVGRVAPRRQAHAAL